MKKVLVGLLAILLIATQTILPITAATEISDVSGHWAEDTILALVEKNYISGYPDGTFKPDNTITRAEFVKILCAIMGYAPATEGISTFSDITEADWSFGYILTAVEKGIIGGYPDNTFLPNNPITRQEASRVVIEAKGIDETLVDAEHVFAQATFTDEASIADWAKLFVAAVVEQGYLKGDTTGAFRPADNLTRAETAAIAWRVLPQTETPTPTANTRTITDMAGRTVVIPAEVNRIVSISPDATIVVYELNGQDKLVGMSLGRIKDQVMPVLEKVYPSSSEIPLVGAFKEASMEQIISLKPDVILAKPFTELDKMSESMGIPAVCIIQESEQELKDSYRLIGQVIGKTKEAEEILAYFETKQKYITERTNNIPPQDEKRVYITAVDPLTTMGGDAYQEFLIKTAGGINVASELKGFGAAVSMEQLLQWDPDAVLVVSYCKFSAKQLLADPLWKTLRSVQEGNVYDYPSFMGPWDAPGSKSIVGMIWLASKLYPDEMNFDMAKEIKEFYSKVYRYDISDDEINQILSPR